MLLILITACSGQPAKYVIGVSQCSADIWREKQNAELRMAAYCTQGVELRFAAAYDSDERQIQQIDSLLKTGIDLLIVAPNQVQTISPAIDRAYDSGIPVIVFERKTNSRKYSAFTSADNYEMGRVMGEYMADRLHGKGKVLEVMGLKGSSPAIDRHSGFVDAIRNHPEVELVATLQGDWTEESAYQAVKNYQGNLSDVDFVFGQNDRMAMGARHAMQERTAQTANAIRYCGIDGLPGEGGGIQLVRDSILDATYIYPTHGDRLLSLAIDILDGHPYEKEVRMMSALVTRSNARVLQMQAEEIMRQSDYLDRLHILADNYLQQLSTQRTITLLACGVIILLLLVFVLSYLYRKGRITLHRERVVNNLWNLDEKSDVPMVAAAVAPQSSETAAEAATEASTPPPAAAPEEPPAEVSAEPSAPSAAFAQASGSMFIVRFKEVVESRLNDSNLSIEDLAAEMNLSRVQLYRRVKSVSGSSPVELLRTARLNRGYQLLLTSGLTVSEVAYAVGFTAPSYFTKCFKEEFGQSPTDVRQ